MANFKPFGKSPHTSLVPLLPIILGASFVYLGYELLETFLPLKSSMHGFSDAIISQMGAYHAMGFALGAVLAPYLVDYLAYFASFLAIATFLVCIMLSYILFVSQNSWSLLYALFGVGMGAMYGVVGAWINEETHNKERGNILGIYYTLNTIVLIGGNVLFAANSYTTNSIFVLDAALLGVGVIPLFFLAKKRRGIFFTKPKGPHTSLWQTFLISPEGVFGVFVVGISSAPFWSIGSLFAEKSGLSHFQIAWFMSLPILGQLTSQWPFARLSDVMDRRLVINILACGSLVGASLLTLASWERQTSLMMFAIFLYGFFSFSLYGLCSALINDAMKLKDGKPIDAQKTMLLLYSLGAGIAPLLNGFIFRITSHGIVLTFAVAIIANAMLFLLSLVLILKRPRERGRFQN